MAIAGRVVIEADGGTRVVESEQLVYGAGHLRRIVVFVAGKDAVPRDEAAVHTITVDPETTGVAAVVDASYLRLSGAGKIFSREVSLLEG